MSLYRVELRFNSRLKGHGQTWSGEVEAADPQTAIDPAIIQVMRLPEHGQSIYLTGATVDEIKS